MTKLRSIPPANRSHRVSSPLGRGVTRFASQARQSSRQPTRNRSIAETIAPDTKWLALRQAIAKSLADKAKFWTEELQRWEAEFGTEYVAKLKADTMSSRADSQETENAETTEQA